jgi:hypothetical protein
VLPDRFTVDALDGRRFRSLKKNYCFFLGLGKSQFLGRHGDLVWKLLQEVRNVFVFFPSVI